ncbi:MAG: hypothetical protein LBN23_01050, partial [Paludibacter sp.]|nr:hypothetical protein [Paludibacter sp.]
MKKQSIYNIWIDRILYNSSSDSAMSFCESEIEGIKYYLENLSDFEKDYPDLMKKFSEFGFLVDENFDELDFILYKNRVETLQNRNYHLTINPTLQCNYRCWYCCVEDQNTKYEQRRMDDETIEKLKKHIKYIIETDRISQLRLDWFGGEPLMYYYEVVYPISKYAIDLCKKHSIPFANHATTNAYYMDNRMIRS